MLRYSLSLVRNGRASKRCLGYWWGHETVEDREKALQKIEDSKILEWQSPDSSLESARGATYTPMRVQKEEKSINVGFDLSRMTLADYYGFVNHPHSLIGYFKHPHIYYAQKRVDEYKKLIRGQKFVKERLLALGPDLAAATFLTSRNCRVKFKGKKTWFGLTHASLLPTVWVKDWHVEAIDASCSDLIYEGIQNLRNLTFLKSLDLSNCPHIDSWCLDRLTGEFQDSLEELDLSGCKLVDWNALECLWRLRNLRVLTLKDMGHIKDLKLLCLMLLEEFPQLEIRGVDYEDKKLLQGSENEHLIEEYEALLLNPGNQQKLISKK